jgi:uroporphyrinogen-III decarboxylase
MAPFDIISDFLRGLKGTNLDMYRCPDKLLAAQEKVLAHMLTPQMGMMADVPLAFMPLHRGSDGFMSLPQFEKFYWPGLKKLILSLIDAGKIPFIFWEGVWDKRLEYLKELPKGKVLGWFDGTDLFKAKEVLGDTMCICGGIPISLLKMSSPEKIRERVREVIDVIGKDGGLIMGPSTVMDDAKPELVKVWVDATKEYGQY